MALTIELLLIISKTLYFTVDGFLLYVFDLS